MPACKARFVLNFEKKVCTKRTFRLEVVSIASLEIYSISVPYKAYTWTPESFRKFSLTDPSSASRELQFQLFIDQNLSKNGNSHSLSLQAWEYTQSHLGQIGPLLACKAHFVLHFEKSLYKTDLPSRSYFNCIFRNLQHLSTLEGSYWASWGF